MTRGALAGAAALVCLLLLAPLSVARAFEPFALQVPCRATAVNDIGTERPCITCHNNADGGAGCAQAPCLNPFGMDFNANGRTWNEALAAMDSDGDGYTNGEELGDPMGTWRIGNASPATCDCATRPGFMSFTPGNEDADEDGYCCRGRDIDGNGDCLGAGENEAGSFDCDDNEATANSAATELCINAIDNDCDGSPTLLDDDCANVVDRDGDGYCPTGIDNNQDRDCIDTGEDTADSDCDDDQVTVSPAAREFCIDSLDNDCDTLTDTDDPECQPPISTTDADDDGFCPIGTDTNDDGMCLGAEANEGFDCDDTLVDVNPSAPEICTDMRDNDCDGFADFRDEEDCGAFFDADGDGYCPGGRDGDGDGNCTGPGETDDPGDCDDENPDISPGVAEICTNGDVDDDCDMQASLADDDCVGFLDVDDDGYCFVGPDNNNDGNCIGAGEDNGNGDCDETRSDVSPEATEDCLDMVDNDCDGSTDASDRGDCDEYRDIDGDGWCLVGQDMNADGDCADPGEQGEESEWTVAEDLEAGRGTEGVPFRYPGAPENCVNGLDDDLDGMTDEAASCGRDVDADSDGYCPIGQDLNGDGDCLDEDENQAVSDCNEGDAEINPGAAERCLEMVDADCDSAVGTDDTDCHVLLDQDGDGFCPTGIDDNADGDCLDEAEDRFGADCDDTNAMVNTRVREVCDDTIDNDCDGDIDLADSQCDCEMDSECDDGDACTLDTCGSDGECSSAPDPACTDAGPAPDAGTEPPPEGCNCRATGSESSPPFVTLALLGLAAMWRRRRRSR